MPYSGPADTTLPKNVQQMQLPERERWVKVYNNSFDRCQADDGEDCEGTAFRIANGTAKKDLKYMDEPIRMMPSRIPQDKANYNALGGSDTQACVNCNWFMSPNGCMLVDSYPMPISPTGKSDFWLARLTNEPEPMPVRIIPAMGDKDSEDKSGLDILESLKGFVGIKAVAHTHALNHVHRHHSGTLHTHAHIHAEDKDDHDTHPSLDEQKDYSPFAIFKDVDGRWRWVAITSNNFRDKDAEIIEESAHLEYVAYADEHNDYGEAWLWHTPGTAWGDADFVDYVDGFLIKIGTVREGYEDVAERLSKESNLGVSHGFYSKYSGKDIISWYRDIEMSPLPLEVAANPWTGITLLKKEAEMGFSDAKKAWLEKMLGPERVESLSGDVKALGDALITAGVDYKEIPEDEPIETPAPEDNKESVTLTAKDITDSVTKALDDSPRLKALDDSIAAILARVSEIEKSDDEKLTEYITAKVATQGKGYVASQSGDNVLGAGDAKLKAGPQTDWFDQVVAQVKE